MTGLWFYTLAAVGLGGLLPRVVIGDRVSLGVSWCAGFAAMVLLAFLCLAVLHLPPDITVVIISIVALAGLVRWARHPAALPRAWIVHPVVILPVIATVMILLNGGVEYLPHTSDEFMNWLGNPLKMHYVGGYHAAAEHLHLLGYMPGWYFTLLLPWQLSGDPILGYSATAPLVMHIGLAGLFFDAAYRAFERRSSSKMLLITLAAWLGLLLYLTAEGTGQLWTDSILIEQPQIYFFTATLFLLYIWNNEETPSRHIPLAVGVILAAAFVLKSAALSLVPAILGAVLILALVRLRSGSAIDIVPIKETALIVGPLFLAYAAWGGVNPITSPSCMISVLATFSETNLAAAASYDAADLARRLGAAVWAYVTSYKTPVLIAATAGIVLMTWSSRFLVPLIIGIWMTIYFAAIYWYHLSCFGDYYFTNLNSIPRFTRVVLQPLHAVGILALLIETIRWVPPRVYELAMTRRLSVGLIAAFCLALMGWQMTQLDRVVVDLTTRKYSNSDPRIAEVRRTATFVAERYADAQVAPLVQFIAQGQDQEILDYARFFAIKPSDGGVRNAYEVARQFSWTDGQRQNIWQSQADRRAVRDILAKADVIWPVAAEDWQWNMLGELMAGNGCDLERGTFALIRGKRGFTCVPKDGHDVQ